EIFVRVETPTAFQQSLPSQDFVQSGDAARELIPNVEQSRIGIRQRSRPFEDIVRLAASIAPARLNSFEQPYRALRPYRPLAQQPSGEMQCSVAQTKIGQQIGNDVVIVPR